MNPVETKRLIIRLFQPDDLEDFYDYAKVEGVGERAGWKHHKSIEETKKILDIFIKEKDVFAIVLKENNKVIGSIGIHKRRDEPIIYQPDEHYLGYVLSKDYWHQVLMSEALFAFVEAVFKETTITTLVAGHFKENMVSKKLLDKLGFVFKRKSWFYASTLNRSFESFEYVLTKLRFFTELEMGKDTSE